MKKVVSVDSLFLLLPTRWRLQGKVEEH